MPSKTECSPRQTTVTNHYSLACVNSLQTKAGRFIINHFMTDYYSSARVNSTLIDSRTDLSKVTL